MSNDIEKSAYDNLVFRLKSERHTWLITGVAGFIGSNLLEALLNLNQQVIGLDNFSTGSKKNLEDVRIKVGSERWSRFHFIQGDICDLEKCQEAMIFPVSMEPVEFVLHQAALGSVPRSIADPLTTNATNITGFLTLLSAARDAHVKNFVYAASSSTYGDHPGLPKVEDVIGKPLSPYAVTKYVNELYADVFNRSYGLNTIGLRYFNVFGRRQNPLGAYAAVIPKWVKAMRSNEIVTILGDGDTSRDFCYIDNTIQANLLAALSENAEALNQVYNVAVGGRTSLNELFMFIRDGLKDLNIIYSLPPAFDNFRAGDVRHSQADISKSARLLGYLPQIDAKEGLRRTVHWYVTNTD